MLLLFRVSKNVRYKREGIKLFHQYFFVSVPKKFGAKKFRRGTILCFAKILVSKKFMEKREGGGREYHVFPSKLFCLSAEKFRR